MSKERPAGPSMLFSSIRMRDLDLRDRIAVSPMCQYAAVDGRANDWHLMHLGQLSMGAGALLITEATHVSPEGRITHGCLGLYDEACEQALARVVGFCRQWGTATLGIQLAHAGRKASTHVPLKGGQPLGETEKPWQTVGPSALPYAPGWHVPEAADEAALAKIEQDFTEAAIRADRLGFELAELHMAHGYLLHQFLSPISNVRNDDLGGDLAGRMRYPLHVFDAVRKVWPEGKPLGVRVSASDWVEGGWDLESTVVLAKELEARGCDFIDVSSGGLDPRQTIEIGPGYQVHFARAIKEATGMAVMSVGMIVEPVQAETIIRDGDADMVALARAVMDDPRWAWHAARELGASTVYPDQYIRCSPDRWPGAAMR